VRRVSLDFKERNASIFGTHFHEGTVFALKDAHPTVLKIDGAGHDMWFDKPAETNGALQSFFEKTAPKK
jgi:pimeloyl-ACP methyl ester carboxylesterase